MAQERGLLDHVADDSIRLTRASVVGELTLAVDTKGAMAGDVSLNAEHIRNAATKTYG